ncbi:MAG: DMT family transporter [Marinomonas sp.]
MRFDPRLFLLTSVALIAFAGNSFLCRWALAGQQIDALSFTLIRLLSGAITLVFLFVLLERKPVAQVFALNLNKADLRPRSFKQRVMPIFGPFLLFTYAAGFSYAYLSLETGIGALILFAAVQISMIGINVVKGERPNLVQWIGILLSFSGFIYLLLPTLSSPSLKGFVLMTIAGVAWGVYSLLAKQKTEVNESALMKTSRNFIWSMPFVMLLLIANLLFIGGDNLLIEANGIYLAIVSGALTSGIGYAIWYQVVKQLSGTLASVSQLLVPVIATAMGISFLGEGIELHFVISSIMVLGGVMIVLLKKA